MEARGGRLESFYPACGEYDVVAIADFPGNVDAGAFAISLAAGRAVKAFRTTPPIDAGEGVDAMRKAGTSTYAPPG